MGPRSYVDCSKRPLRVAGLGAASNAVIATASRAFAVECVVDKGSVER